MWSPVRSQQASPETAPFESGFLEPLVQGGSIYSRNSSAASGPLLVHHELVRFAEEDLRGEVPALFTTQGTLDRDGLKWELPDAGRHVAAALLAGHDEGLAG